jgi:hypothetical protein
MTLSTFPTFLTFLTQRRCGSRAPGSSQQGLERHESLGPLTGTPPMRRPHGS